MTSAPADSLTAAIARNCAAVISFPSAGMMRHHKTRLLGEAEGGFWIESVPSEAALIDALISNSGQVGIAFKNGQRKIVFATVIWRRQADYKINDETRAEALLLRFPDEVKSVQRRSHYRVNLHDYMEIGLRVWAIGDEWYLKEKPSATLLIPCTGQDMSIGGLGLLATGGIGKDNKPILADQRLRIEFKYLEHEVLLEGRVRYLRELPNGHKRIGVEFQKLENGLEGRQMLSKLTNMVGQLHREEVRHNRLLK